MLLGFPERADARLQDQSKHRGLHDVWVITGEQAESNVLAASGTPKYTNNCLRMQVDSYNIFDTEILSFQNIANTAKKKTPGGEPGVFTVQLKP
jgi:hypothetical protein